MRKFPIALLTAAALLPLAAYAQDIVRSRPTMAPIVQTVPAPRDIPYAPGAMRLEVDATDTQRHILRVRQTIPVAATGGPLTLLFPKWLPGNHAPRGQIEKLAGLRILADGKPVAWTRDPLEVYAFHLRLPAGTKAITAEFQFLSATVPAQGRVVMTPDIVNLQWEQVSLYPAGYYARQIPVQARVTWPAGFKAATALRGSAAGVTTTYDQTDYETLIDSPVFAGRWFKAIDLGNKATLNIVADSKEELDAKPDQIAAHAKLVAEAVALFGTRQYDHYDFLLAISDQLGGIGLEHHRSSENQVDPGYFTKWNDGPGDRNLLPHELTHSWNGKYRRPERLWTPEYSVPMQDNLLWVYEGQTQFWGYVLGARSGLYTKEQTLDALAMIAARYAALPGRGWRSVEDTTHDPIISARRPKGWQSWQRSEDYYNEGLLVWLEADGIIRKQSRGAKGLEDFARAFFGGQEGDWGQKTYGRSELVDALNAIQPYDWSGFIASRIESPQAPEPTAGLTLGGYRLAYGAAPSTASKNFESTYKGVDQSFGVGLIVKNEGDIGAVIWDSPAYKAGLTVGMQITAVNGLAFSAEVFRKALAAGAPLALVVKDGKRMTNIGVDYSGGLRYPRLEKIGEGESGLDLLLRPKT